MNFETINKKIKVIRQILDKFNNPIYFFDNDVDGLASFLLLRKFWNKGKAVAIKSFPELNASYARKISELSADCVFILDKPRVSSEFLYYVNQQGLNVVWIDHHEDNTGAEGVSLFLNPTIEIKVNRPTTYWAYKIIHEQKNYAWIAALGCVADWFIPDFMHEVFNSYKNLFEISKSQLCDAGKILYETTFGKLVLLLNFGLKDTTTNIMKMVKFLVDVNEPYQILEENKENMTMHKRFKQIYRTYAKLLERAKKFSKHDVLFFQYGGDMSISAELSNALFYMYPDKLIVVAHLKGNRAKISIRSAKDVRAIVLKAIEGLENASGGGHAKALGVNMSVADLPYFKEKIIRLWHELKR